MPRMTFTQENMPQTEEEFLEALRQAEENTSPVEDLIRFAQDLRELEIKYGIESSEFYERFQRGEMGDDLDFIWWAGIYEMHEQLKSRLESRLEAQEQHAQPAAP